jgi:hypothetical protein
VAGILIIEVFLSGWIGWLVGWLDVGVWLDLVWFGLVWLEYLCVCMFRSFALYKLLVAECLCAWALPKVLDVSARPSFVLTSAIVVQPPLLHWAQMTCVGSRGGSGHSRRRTRRETSGVVWSR